MRARTAAIAAVALFAWLIAAGAPAPAQTTELPKAAAVELDQGQLLLQHREYFEALKRLTRANQLAGNNCVECLLSMAEAMNGMKAYPNALATIAKALEIAAGSPQWTARALLVRAQAFRELAEKDPARYRDAETALRAAMAADPKSRDIDDMRYDLGVLLLKQNRDAEGIEELKPLADKRTDSFGDDVRALMANPRRAREHYAPDFSIVAVDGTRITLESLRGKVVLIDFWATWCQPCVKALPSIKKLQKAHANDPFVLLSISGDKDESAWRRFTVKNEMTWPQYYDRDSSFQGQFGVRGLPTYVLLDGEGIERFRVVGTAFSESRALSDAIQKALASPAPAPH